MICSRSTPSVLCRHTFDRHFCTVGHVDGLWILILYVRCDVSKPFCEVNWLKYERQSIHSWSSLSAGYHLVDVAAVSINVSLSACCSGINVFGPEVQVWCTVHVCRLMLSCIVGRINLWSLSYLSKALSTKKSGYVHGTFCDHYISIFDHIEVLNATTVT